MAGNISVKEHGADLQERIDRTVEDILNSREGKKLLKLPKGTPNDEIAAAVGKLTRQHTKDERGPYHMNLRTGIFDKLVESVRRAQEQRESNQEALHIDVRRKKTHDEVDDTFTGKRLQKIVRGVLPKKRMQGFATLSKEGLQRNLQRFLMRYRLNRAEHKLAMETLIKTVEEYKQRKTREKVKIKKRRKPKTRPKITIPPTVADQPIETTAEASETARAPETRETKGQWRLARKIVTPERAASLLKLKAEPLMKVLERRLKDYLAEHPDTDVSDEDRPYLLQAMAQRVTIERNRQAMKKRAMEKRREPTRSPRARRRRKKLKIAIRDRQNTVPETAPAPAPIDDEHVTSYDILEHDARAILTESSRKRFLKFPKNTTKATLAKEARAQIKRYLSRNDVGMNEASQKRLVQVLVKAAQELRNGELPRWEAEALVQKHVDRRTEDLMNRVSEETQEAVRDAGPEPDAATYQALHARFLWDIEEANRSLSDEEKTVAPHLSEFEAFYEDLYNWAVTHAPEDLQSQEQSPSNRSGGSYFNEGENAEPITSMAENIANALSAKSIQALLTTSKKKARKALKRYLGDKEIYLFGGDLDQLLEELIPHLMGKTAEERIKMADWVNQVSPIDREVGESLERIVRMAPEKAEQINRNALMILSQIRSFGNYREEDRALLMVELLQKLKEDLATGKNTIQDRAPANPDSHSERIRQRIWVTSPNKGRALAEAVSQHLQRAINELSEERPTPPPPTQPDSLPPTFPDQPIQRELPPETEKYFKQVRGFISTAEVTGDLALSNFNKAEALLKQAQQSGDASRSEALQQEAHKLIQKGFTGMMALIDRDIPRARTGLNKLNRELYAVGMLDDKTALDRFHELVGQLDIISDTTELNDRYNEVFGLMNKLSRQTPAKPKKNKQKQAKTPTQKSTPAGEKNSFEISEELDGGQMSRYPDSPAIPDHASFPPLPAHPAPFTPPPLPTPTTPPQAPKNPRPKPKAPQVPKAPKRPGQKAPLEIEAATETATPKPAESEESLQKRMREAELVNALLQAKHNFPEGSRVEFTTQDGKKVNGRISYTPVEKTDGKHYISLEREDSDRAFAFLVTHENLSRLRKLGEQPSIQGKHIAPQKEEGERLDQSAIDNNFKSAQTMIEPALTAKVQFVYAVRNAHELVEKLRNGEIAPEEKEKALQQLAKYTKRAKKKNKELHQHISMAEMATESLWEVLDGKGLMKVDNPSEEQKLIRERFFDFDRQVINLRNAPYGSKTTTVDDQLKALLQEEKEVLASQEESEEIDTSPRIVYTGEDDEERASA